jgi:hypothetical protein
MTRMPLWRLVTLLAVTLAPITTVLDTLSAPFNHGG